MSEQRRGKEGEEREREREKSCLRISIPELDLKKLTTRPVDAAGGRGGGRGGAALHGRRARRLPLPEDERARVCAGERQRGERGERGEHGDGGGGHVEKRRAGATDGIHGWALELEAEGGVHAWKLISIG